MEWSATIEGRIASKKNSKRVFKNKYTGKTVVASSDAYGRWHEAASKQLIDKRPKTPIEGDTTLYCTFHLKGKIDSDLDNMMASVADLLQDIGVIANDKQITTAVLTKRHGYQDFYTDIRIVTL